MTDYKQVAEVYTRALSIARDAYGRFPAEVEAVVAGIEGDLSAGEKARAGLHLKEFVRDVVNPLALSMRARIDQAHQEIMEILKLRLKVLEFLHTLASEHQQFEKCAQFAAEMELLNKFLLEDFLVSLNDDSQ